MLAVACLWLFASSAAFSIGRYHLSSVQVRDKRMKVLREIKAEHAS